MATSKPLKNKKLWLKAPTYRRPPKATVPDSIKGQCVDI